MENERNVSPVSAHAFNNEKPPCESRVVSLYLGIINRSNHAVLDGGIAMPVGTAGACRRIQLMVRLATQSMAAGMLTVPSPSAKVNTPFVYVTVRSIARLPLSET